MISVKDTSILAMLSRFPSMPAEEADQYIAQIEHEENIPLCLAVLGRIPASHLDEGAQVTYREFVRWSEDRTRRFRNERIANRQREREDRIASRLLQLHQSGSISEDVLVLYGISGELPERNTYHLMTVEERKVLWTRRMEERYGPTWRRHAPGFSKLWETLATHNWIKEGF